MARPRWSTGCCSNPAPSARTSGSGRARDGFQRSRARARHHHPRQGDLDPVEGHPHQHRRYAGPRRFRRRGRAHPQHGGRRAGAGRCRRRARCRRPSSWCRRRCKHGPEADRRDQQGRPPGRARRPRCVNEVFDLFAALDATDEQLDFPILYGSAKQGWMADKPRRPAGPRHDAAVRSGAAARAAADGRGRPVPPARHHPRSQSLSRPRRHRPHRLRRDQAEPAGQGARPRRQADRAGPRHQGAGVPRARAHAGRRGGGRRHRRHRGPAERDRRAHDLRARSRDAAAARSRSIRRRWR